MKLLAEASAAQLALKAMHEDLLRAIIAGSDDVGSLQERVDGQHARVMELTQLLLEALRTQ